MGNLNEFFYYKLNYHELKEPPFQGSLVSPSNPGLRFYERLLGIFFKRRDAETQRRRDAENGLHD
jgi:hypothetical protein